ncbi:hypothetical protein METHB2_700021 [Candidatus Methylobacter favarea]|uniref:Uncharacterized protein n=1 Tax=Candidatus Methylobacter favarea TaxID=2707345 RepID=A0A8S0X9P5_9GAMM|nr:hypothetical protein [Candidatus Methylobacter favarea]CAA9892526.1 hypothetical protein METHB2_700021 [Candidatus Methylobacter favarea]
MQDFFSLANNVFGQSDDGISLELTEIGLNAAYQPFYRLRFAAQVLYRRAGNIDSGSVRLDSGSADLPLFNYKRDRMGIPSVCITRPAIYLLSIQPYCCPKELTLSIPAP